MTEQWQELKETIIELRDNNGTCTQQEVCKFLANLMDVLERQMNDSEKPNKCDDTVSKEYLKKDMIRYGWKHPDSTVTEYVDNLPSVSTKKTALYSGDGYADGYMVYDMAECPNCGYKYEDGDKDWGLPFCPNCGQSLNWESEE